MDAAEIEARLDPLEALPALGFPDVSDICRVKGGWETLLWRFKTPDGGEHSLRVYHLPRVRGIAWRERVALEACAAADLPAPRVQAVGEVMDVPAMVLSWCPGVPILSYVEKKPWLLWRLGRIFGRAQAQLHAVSPPEEFISTAPDDWISRVDDKYADLADHARSLNLSASSLIHFDYHPLNVISDGDSVTGVIDWSGAAAGDPRADLARTEITIQAAPLPPGPLRPLLSLGRGIILRSWRSGYQQTAGPMPEYRPLRAWAGATLVTEIESIIDNPNVWGTERDLINFRRLIDLWARDAGVRYYHSL
jgi:aminoglycoside phosphotransferase (APT) family kinase protein